MPLFFHGLSLYTREIFFHELISFFFFGINQSMINTFYQFFITQFNSHNFKCQGRTFSQTIKVVREKHFFFRRENK